MKQKESVFGLFTFEFESRTRFVFATHRKGRTVKIAESSNGLDFHILSQSPTIFYKEKELDQWGSIKWAKVSECANKHILVYAAKRSFLVPTATEIAESRDGMSWEILGKSHFSRPTIIIETVTSGKKTYTAYALSAHGYITASTSKNLKRWRKYGLALSPRSGMFDAQDLEPICAGILQSYMIVLYVAKSSMGRVTVGAALFDAHAPNEPTWRSDMPIWTAPPEWDSDTVRLVGSAIEQKYLYLYIERNGFVEAMPVPKYWERPFQKNLSKKQATKKTRFRKQNTPGTVLLERFGENPILEPIEEHPWESFATFNPAAFTDEGIVHLVYRAQSHAGLSVLGYANSQDGYRVHFRSNLPAYIPREPFEAGHGIPDPKHVQKQYMSAGGWGGCEDPKVTLIDGRVYVTYVAFNGWQPPRIALAWIPLADFLKKRWRCWSKPTLISPPGVVDKSAAILPEKIDGKYVIFHRIFPNILIDFVDSLDDFDGNTYLEGRYYIAPREGFWDCGKLSVGAPPIKTKKGWLVIYHAVSGRIEHGGDLRYKIGAMLLDLKDPTRVLARSREPILEPETDYENNGHKYGIAYPCGAVEKDEKLFVYYGASDKTTAVATAPMQEFLEALVQEKTPKLKKVSFSSKSKRK